MARFLINCQKIDSDGFWVKFMRGLLLLKGGVKSSPGFWSIVRKLTSQGQGGTRGKGQGCDEVRRGDRAGQAGKARSTYLAGVQVHL